MARNFRTGWIALSAVVIGVLTAASMTAAANAEAAPCRVRNLQSAQVSTDLQSAIDAASSGDRLRISGTCVGNFSVASSITLRGGQTTPGTLDGGGNGVTLTVSSGASVRVRSLTITGGLNTVGYGGGIDNEGILRINRSTITDNHATVLEGGGIESGFESRLILHGTTVSGNSAVKGGGIHMSVFSYAALNHSTVSGNTTDQSGGGINLENSTLNLNDTSVPETPREQPAGGS